MNGKLLAGCSAFVGVVVAIALRTTGVVGEVGFQRILIVTLILDVYLLAATLHVQTREVRAFAEAFDSIRAMPSVRCAGCRRAATLASGPVGDGGVPMPPGWAMKNDRPYCRACLG